MLRRIAKAWNTRRLSVPWVIASASLILCFAAIAGGMDTEPDENRGGLVAFYSERDGDSEILIMNVDGSGIRQLTDNDCADDVPALSPDGRFLAFASERTGNAEIFVIDLVDLSVRQLTNTLEAETHPDWSPDGTMLAFARYSPGTWSDGDLFLMDVGGHSERQLTSHPGDDMRPAWFADGMKLLFSSNRDGNYEIYEIAASGASLRRVTNTPLHELFPRPSPDGTKIVYTLGDFVRRRFSVHVMNLDGSDDQALTEGGHVSGEDPMWAGDGSRILFQSDRTGNFEIFMMNSDGSDQTNLTNLPSGEYWPTWSPSLLGD
ncbi:PD40 domain-containing protein [Candidatus Bipolaricaulota bacterium]|nr:PD40 domain-containing protein [Candidatus Bipolaricaulota bacterium]